MSASTHEAVETPVCVRCTDRITMGHAYELGGNRWHTHCFSCYKCDKPLSCDSDFLVLGTSDLICFECSDSCKSCGKKIDDLAIILASSNEAYCSDCFKCCKCGEKIKDLRYAKTKKGLFCISCHERLLARRKYHEEKKRRLKKELPIVPKEPDSSATNSVMESETATSQTSHTLDPMIKTESGVLETTNSNLGQNGNSTPESDPFSVLSPSNAADKLESANIQQKQTPNYEDIEQPKVFTAPIDFSKKESIVKSSSNSVIAQFLDDEYHNDNVSVTTTEHKHSSSQLDKILQNTLDNSEEDTLQISSNDIASLSYNNSNPDIPEINPHRTPVRSSERSPPLAIPNSKSPDGHRNAIIFDADSPENEVVYATKENHLNTPNRRNTSAGDESFLHTPNSSGNDHKPAGLGISTPRSLQKFKLNGSLAIISPRSEVVKNTNTVGIPYDSTEERPSSHNSDMAHTVNNSAPDHHRRTSSGAKNITRSLSFRSKNIISTFRNKAKSNVSPGRPLDKDFDTHSGWGVSASHPSIEESLSSQTAHQPRRRVSGRGQSDSTIYSPFSNDSTQQSQNQGQGHIRSQSGSNKVSMFRTPPLGSIDSGRYTRNKSLSIDANQTLLAEDEKGTDGDDTGDYTPVAKEFFEKDLASASLQLRKLNMEIKELQLTKAQLNADIEKLKSSKESLTIEVEKLKNEKKGLRSGTTSQESFQDDAYYTDYHGSSGNGYSPTKNPHSATSASASIAKPRFWKLFGAGSGSGNGNGNGNGYGNVKQVTPNSSKSIEISAPMLQNPNEFDDMKLLPIQNSTSSDSGTRNSASSAMSEGQNLYGSTLSARCNYERRDVPLIITTCIDYIESDEERMKTEGIYRKSGSQIVIEQFEKMFADEEKVDFVKMNADVHAVTSVLKRYLRKLPNPILSYQCYEALINLVRDNNLLIEYPLSKSTKPSTLYHNAVERLVGIMQTLPVQNLIVLRLLCQHLDQIIKYQDDNLMTLHNLALVFAPGLIKDYSGEKDIVDMKERNYLIGFILQNYRDIFSMILQQRTE